MILNDLYNQFALYGDRSFANQAEIYGRKALES